MRGNNLLTDLVIRDIPVTLIGKTADLFADAIPEAAGYPATSSSAVAHHLLDTLKRQTEGFIFVNDRQVDLASHTGGPSSRRNSSRRNRRNDRRFTRQPVER